ncbi:MAG: DNA polymerase III subunit epsilon [Burkholderiaceae bacterium]|nr:DNA polymerase III subunit epsilon [Burkholderiaceae bacterium]
MRQVVLDTETTGLSVDDGHRIIEIGCVEVVNRRVSARHLHLYLNPQREIDEGASAVHGMTLEMLLDKPLFSQVARSLLEFVHGAEVVIHNAPFDEGFLDAELRRCGHEPFRRGCAGVLDTLRMARDLHPGKRNSLDALCERYGVSNAHRRLHGALLDAELLAEVYLAMTRGQDSLEIGLRDLPVHGDDARQAIDWPPRGLVLARATPEEAAAHVSLLERMGRESGRSPLWPGSGGLE